MPGDIILLTKRDPFSLEAQAIARTAFGNLIIHEGDGGESEPDDLSTAKPRFLISFLSPWIVRKATLDRSAVAINFHPGPVEYPGIGCYNFALYDGAREYGAVCHHMLPKVDTGNIIMERRFAVARRETVETLKLTTMVTMLGMFREVVAMLAAQRALPQAAVHWTRKPYTRRNLEALKVLDWTMSLTEIERRSRATIYPGYPGPTIKLCDGSVHVLPVPSRRALA